MGADEVGSNTGAPVKARRENILVVQTSFIGDVVLAQPLLAALRHEFPRSNLDVLCTPLTADLVRSNPHVDHVLAFDKRGEARGLRGLHRFAAELQARSYTIAVAAHKSFRTAWLITLARIPLRIGFRQSSGWFLYHRRVWRDAAQHEVLRNLSLLSGLGFDPREVEPDLTLAVAPDEYSSAQKKLEQLGAFQSQKPFLFGINPGSVWPTKRWSIEAFAGLIMALKGEYACEVLIFGGPDDVSTGKAIQQRCGDAAIDLTGCFKLAELPAALGRCDVLISTDSAPMHMAVARGVPVIAVFCATTPSLGFYPFSGKSVVVQKDLHCRPCGSHGGRRCPLGTYACIEGVGVKSVLDCVRRILEQPRAGVSCSYLPEFVTV